MRFESARRQLSAALIERHDHHILIMRGESSGETSPGWLFPRGAVRVGESPEAAMRRIAREQLGIDIDIVAGQPPFVEVVGGEQFELRYFFCGVARGEIVGDPQRLRWIPKAHLREYEFDTFSRPVAEWLLEN